MKNISKKRKIRWIALLLLLGTLAANCLAQFGGGSGTEKIAHLKNTTNYVEGK